MARRTPKSIFYHIPKTGGVWATRAIRRSVKKIRVVKFDYGMKVDDATIWRRRVAHIMNLKRQHETQWGVLKKEKNGVFSFAFVREPLSWYRSWWAMRDWHKRTWSESPRATQQNGLWERNPLDYALNDSNPCNGYKQDSSDFEKFVINALNMFKTGPLTTIYKCFLGENGDTLDFVGKQENLKEDLIEALTLAGENFDERKIKTLPKKNVRTQRKKFSKSFGISNEIVKRLRDREKWIYERFYKDIQ